jgi:hypothetical protein
MIKLPTYARHGVQFAWIAEPLQESIEVFRREREGWLLVRVAGGDDVARLEPFEAFQFPLSTLWLAQNRPA